MIFFTTYLAHKRLGNHIREKTPIARWLISRGAWKELGMFKACYALFAITCLYRVKRRLGKEGEGAAFLLSNAFIWLVVISTSRILRKHWHDAR